MQRIENILKLNCYDKNIFKREEIIKEKALFRKIGKEIEP